MDQFRGKKDDSGFTLIETLVATMVFALVMSALYQGLSLGWRGLRKAQLEDAALTVARNVLATSGIESALVPATRTGTSADGITWQAEIWPYAAATAMPEANLSYLGYWVTVTVRWREGQYLPEHSLQMTTLKMKKAS